MPPAYHRESDLGHVLDHIGIGADVALAVTAFVGAYYAFVSSRLFRGDFIMERVWRLATASFAITAFLSVLDFLLTTVNSPRAISLGQYCTSFRHGHLRRRGDDARKVGEVIYGTENWTVITVSPTLIVGWEWKYFLTSSSNAPRSTTLHLGPRS